MKGWIGSVTLVRGKRERDLERYKDEDLSYILVTSPRWLAGRMDGRQDGSRWTREDRES